VWCLATRMECCLFEPGHVVLHWGPPPSSLAAALPPVLTHVHLLLGCELQAAKLCPSDPLVANELGVLAYRSRQYDVASGWLRRALSLVPAGRPTSSEWLSVLCCMSAAVVLCVVLCWCRWCSA
jgi:hypothetical protein